MPLILIEKRKLSKCPKTRIGKINDDTPIKCILCGVDVKP